jgi:TonB-dependent receptor
MNTLRLLRPLCVAIALAVFSSVPTLLAQSTGTITGRVLNATTGAYLPGASIAIEGAAASEVSGEGGTFRLNDVPGGALTLVVTYPGLDASRVAVSVTAGGSRDLTVELSSKIYQLDAFKVSELREGEAAAVARQRAAENIKQVVSTDTFGNVADTNVGNLLLRLPGIAGQRDEAEVHLVSIRGIDPQFNSVMVDGTRLSGATTRANGLSRGFEIDKVSTNSIESIEVIKAQLPEMDADAIGGTVNLKTKSGFDRKGREFRWALGANIYPERSKYNPSASLAYSDVLGRERRLGVAFNLSYNRSYGPRLAFRANYLNPTFTAPAAMSEFQTTEDEILLTRIGTGLKLDYKLSPTTSLFFNTLYNNYLDAMTQHKMRIRLGTAARIHEGNVRERMAETARRSWSSAMREVKSVVV